MLQSLTFYVVWRLWRDSFRTSWIIAVELRQAFAPLFWERIASTVGHKFDL